MITILKEVIATNKMKWIKRISILLLLLIVTIPLGLSAYRAKNIADDVIKPANDEIVFNKIGFSPSIYFDSNDSPEKYTNNWRVSYCPRNGFCCFPIEVYVSLLGTIVLINPRNLKEKISKKL